MMAAVRGQTQQGRRQGQVAKAARTAILGNAMPAKKTPQTAKRKKSETSPLPAYATSTITMATQNLINMVAVFAVSGAVLLGLLAAKHF
jgi:hypothetical protein